MAKCDLCGENCAAHSLNQLREPYRVPGVVDLCPTCAKWADKTKDDMVAEIGPRMRAAVAARRRQCGPKYLLCPGHVISQKDGQEHFVDERALARLYGVPMDQCVVRPIRMFHRFGWRKPDGVIELRPRYDGDYTLPGEDA